MWYISPFDFRAIFIRGKKLIRKLLIVQLHVYIELYLNKEDLELSFFKVDDCVILTEDTS